MSTCISESVGQSVDDLIQHAQKAIKAKHSLCFKNPLELPVFDIKVEPADADRVRAAFEKGQIGFQTKVSYNSSTCEMLFYFLPSKLHNRAVAGFEEMLMARLDLLAFNQPIRQYMRSGNTTFTLPNGLKEPDMYISPLTRPKEDPTLVLEVGYSERMSELRLDARRWLSRNPPVLLVVLIDLKKSNVTGTPPTVTVEHWTRTTLRHHVESVYSQIWTYGNNLDYHIHLDCIFETVPQQFFTNGIPKDLVIPAPLVDNFMEGVHNSWVAML